MKPDRLLEHAIRVRDFNRERRLPFRNQSHGCAIYTNQNIVFARGNVEVKSARFSLCAEQLTMADVKSFVEPQSIDLMVVCGDGPEIACPCGICLQMAADFPKFHIMLSNHDGSKYRMTSNKDLLPYAY